MPFSDVKFSISINCLPLRTGTKVMHELIDLYKILLFFSSPKTIVQAPHPPSAQPSFVPVFFKFDLTKFKTVSFGSGFKIW